MPVKHILLTYRAFVSLLFARPRMRMRSSLAVKNINGQLLNRVVLKPKYSYNKHATKGHLKHLSRVMTSWSTPDDRVNDENYDKSGKQRLNASCTLLNRSIFAGVWA